MTQASDETLIRATIGGDQRAYATLVSRHQDTVAKFIWRLIPVEEDREEVCQDVFVRVYDNLSRFRFDAKFSTWLYRIAYTTALSFLRKKRYATQEFQEQASNIHAPEKQLSETQISDILEQEISRLTVDERTVVTLYHLQGCGVDEIANIMERSPGTIKSQLFRSRKKLKDRLQGIYHE
ncbi:MAG: sigma-70 family RNA polymerase sigma factor [Pseudomonadales bacterium]|nr:sigma-70 family RNA polymerase sigma factor [Pseudomonadales bacterium]